MENHLIYIHSILSGKVAPGFDSKSGRSKGLLEETAPQITISNPGTMLLPGRFVIFPGFFHFLWSLRRLKMLE